MRLSGSTWGPASDSGCCHGAVCRFCTGRPTTRLATRPSPICSFAGSSSSQWLRVQRRISATSCRAIERAKMIYDYGQRHVELLGECFIAPSADVIGSVRLGNQSSIWFGAVLRGDNDWIHVGEGSNIQDGSIVHVDPGVPVMIGRNVTVGHGVMLHGCVIGDGCLIGNRAIV